MPISKRKKNGKSNVEEAGHVKAARARQAADSLVESAGTKRHNLMEAGASACATIGRCPFSFSAPSVSVLASMFAAFVSLALCHSITFATRLDSTRFDSIYP